MAEGTLEDLIRRYEEGDRSPGLIQQLNEAAWEGFHDPWEGARAPSDPSEETMVDTPYDPEAVRPLSLDMIERFIQKKGWSFWKKSDQYLMVTIRYDRASDRETRLLLCTAGKNREIFQLHWTSDRRVGAERFDQAFRLCNAWNDRTRWPRAFVEVPPKESEDGPQDDPEPLSGTLVLDFQLFLAAGIHQALFDSLVQEAIATGWDFWEKAFGTYGL